MSIRHTSELARPLCVTRPLNRHAIARSPPYPHHRNVIYLNVPYLTYLTLRYLTLPCLSIRSKNLKREAAGVVYRC